MAGSQETQEEELDPNIEFIRKRMMKMMMISIGILSIGLLALLFAIIYKVKVGAKNKETTQVAAQTSQEKDKEHGKKHDGKHGKKHRKLAEKIDVDIPQGARITRSEVQRGRLILDMRLNGDTLIWIINLHSGEVVSRVTLK